MQPTLENLADFARVPEHGVEMMRGLSWGAPILSGPYLFFAGEDWLSAIAYPLHGKYEDKNFKDAFEEVRGQLQVDSCFAIGPRLPAGFNAETVDVDRYYILGLESGTPKKFKNSVAKAREKLEISESAFFTAGHRQLWAEFLERARIGAGSGMSDRVRELYARTPGAMRTANSGLRFLDARDGEGRLVATLLLDFSPTRFTSYILGAHSRKNYVPHAHDLLFEEMIIRSRVAGKRFLHLGLGVNEGILRFKLKWGAKPYFPYTLSRWQASSPLSVQIPETLEHESIGQTLALTLMRFQGNVSARQALGDTPTYKPFAMLWKVQKNERVSWLGGTAHFFCHSFEPSFRKLFRQVDNVVFEGPLDQEFMAQVDAAGKSLSGDMTPLIKLMNEKEITHLERVVGGPRGKMAQILGIARKRPKDVRWFLAHASPWHAFFSLWTAFLERRGWRDSVDMEAWRVAREMGKNVIGMETLEEQLESLGSLPVERVLNFFRSCGQWKIRSQRNMRAYLAGDLERMMGSSAEFPTRTEHVIGKRDQRFRERMRPYLEEGRCAVFVGSAHIVNLRKMLVEDGFTVVQQPFGILPKIKLKIRNMRGLEDVQW